MGGQYSLAFWLALAALIFFVIALLALLRAIAVMNATASGLEERPLPSPLGASAKMRIVWSRLVPRFPIDEKLDELIEGLRAIRTEAFVWLSTNTAKAARPTIDEVRANVFFPGQAMPAPGDSCVLNHGNLSTTIF